MIFFDSSNFFLKKLNIDLKIRQQENRQHFRSLENVHISAYIKFWISYGYMGDPVSHWREMARPLSHFLGAIVTTSSRRSVDDDDGGHDDEDLALQLRAGGFSTRKLEFGNQLSSDPKIAFDPLSSLSSGFGLVSFFCKIFRIIFLC